MTHFDRMHRPDHHAEAEAIDTHEKKPWTVQMKKSLKGASFDEGMAALSPNSTQASTSLSSVQFRQLKTEGGRAAEAKHEGIPETARKGLDGPTSNYPHRDQIQASFGRTIPAQAHVGGSAHEACHQMGAEAYTANGAVAFSEQPSLHTAAHEAAHTLQQQAGVQLSGGVGVSGDVHEQAADRAADLVVEGRSAHHLFSGTRGTPSAAVQLKGKRGEKGIPEGHTIPDEKHYKRARRYEERQRAKKGEEGDVDDDQSFQHDADRDKVIDHIIKDPAERAKAFATYGIKQTAEDMDRETAEEQFVKDVESGLAHAERYFKYIQEAMEYWEKFGEWIGIDLALGGLDKIAGTFKGHLGRAKKIAGRAREAVAFAQAVDKFVDDWRSFNPEEDAESVERWLGSVRHLQEKTEPFIDWAREGLFRGAMKGGAVAANALVVLNFTVVMLEGGVKMAQNGVRVMNQAVESRHGPIREFEACEVRGGVRCQERGPKEEEIPPPPSKPPRWKSRREEHSAARASDNRRLMAAKRARHQRELVQAVADFEEREWPKLYRKNRYRIKRKILEKLRAAKAGGGSRAQKWWNCMLEDIARVNRCKVRRETYDDLRETCFWDDRAGMVIYPRKRSVSLKQAKKELKQFRDSSTPPCPLLEELFIPALDAFVNKRLAALKAPEPAPDIAILKSMFEAMGNAAVAAILDFF